MNWKHIPSYELYEASDSGQIRNARNQRVLHPYLSNNGYMTIKLNSYSKVILVHRAIITAFLPNPLNKPYCNHKDGNKLNNNLENLEWCTGKENRIHAIKTGLIKTTKGIRSHSKLDEGQVLTIRKCLADGMQCGPLAAYFKVSQTLISAIKRRVAWASL